MLVSARHEPITRERLAVDCRAQLRSRLENAVLSRLLMILPTLDARLRGWPLRGIVMLALVAVLLPLSLRRLIDGDEGYLLMAGRLVSEGQRPYADFFSPQMPALAYIFGFWFSVLGRSWVGARVLCSLVAAATGLCLFEYVWRATRSRAWALVGVGFYLAHGFVLGWFTIAKTYGLTAFFAMAGALALVLPRRHLTLVLGGLGFALAAQTRLYAAVLLPCGAFFLLRDNGWHRRTLNALAWYTLGAGLGALPILPSLWASPEALWFGIMEFHGMREAGQNALVGDLKQKWEMLLNLLPFKGMEGPSHVQFLFVLVLALVARVAHVSKGFGVAGIAWLTLFAASLLPTPTHAQYFCVLVPLLIADGLTLMAGRPFSSAWAPVLVVSGFYLGMGTMEAERYTKTGLHVPGVWTPDRVERWSLKTMKQVQRAIDAQQVSEAASWWPGYFVGSKTRLVSGLTNDFGLRVADRVTPEKKAQYHLASHADMAAMIVARAPRLFVEGNWAATPIANLLPANAYVLSATVSNVRVWVAPAP